MWKVGAFTNGAWREVQPMTLEGVPFSSAALLEVASTSNRINGRLLVSVGRGKGARRVARAIELWGAKTAAIARVGLGRAPRRDRH